MSLKSRPCADEINFADQASVHSSAISITLKRKIGNFAHPHRACLKLGLTRNRIARADRQVIRRFEKAFVPAPMKRQKTCALDDLFGDSRLRHHFAAA